MFPAYSVKARN